MNIIKVLIVATLFTSTISYANDLNVGNQTINTNAGPPTPFSRENDGIGSNATPINDYAPLLIITAVTIAGFISYKQRQLIKK